MQNILFKPSWQSIVSLTIIHIETEIITHVSFQVKFHSLRVEETLLRSNHLRVKFFLNLQEYKS